MWPMADIPGSYPGSDKGCFLDGTVVHHKLPDEKKHCESVLPKKVA